MKQKFTSLRKNTDGAVSVEYALLIGLIAMVLIVVFNEISASNQALLNTVSDNIEAQTPS